jgi:ParB-like chromosome segregation protein Spo0J
MEGMKSPATQRRTISIDSIVGNPRNDRVHEADQIELLVASIKRFGQPRPILVRQENMMIIAGHGVWQAMREAGLRDIDVLLWDVDQKTADGYLVADNRFGELSYSDQARRRALLEDVDPDDYDSIGFAPDEVEELLSGGEDIAVEELDTDVVADTFWINCQGPLEQQAAVLRRMQQLMSEFPEVTVELGTVQ